MTENLDAHIDLVGNKYVTPINTGPRGCSDAQVTEILKYVNNLEINIIFLPNESLDLIKLNSQF